MFLTLFVNTVINIVIASRVLRERLTGSPCAAFIGDDNIVKGVKSDKLMADRCATWLNMEVKIIDAVVGEKAPYFCGGFILCDSVTGTACRVADPLKGCLSLANLWQQTMNMMMTGEGHCMKSQHAGTEWVFFQSCARQ